MVLKKIIGILILIPIWFYAANPIIPGGFVSASPEDYTVKGTVTLLVLGLSYCLFNNKDYPVKFILTAIISNLIAYKLKINDDSQAGEVIYTMNLYIGVILVLTGNYGINFFIAILTPIQLFLESVKINLPMSIIAGILIFPIAYIAPEIHGWWHNYQLEQKIRDSGK